MKIARKIGIAWVILAITAAFAMLFLPTAAGVLAADDNTVVLKPVTAKSDITYHWFAAPTSVHADASGIYVADGGEIVTVAPDMSFASHAFEAQKAYRHGEVFISLLNGQLYYGDDTTPYSSPERFTDFDIFADKLYAVSARHITVIPLTESGFDTANATAPLALAHEITDKFQASAVTVTEDGVFVAITCAAFAGMTDIATVNMSTGAMTTVRIQSGAVGALTAMKNTGVIYVMTADRVNGYTMYGGGLVDKYSSDTAHLTDIYAYDGFLYAIDKYNAVHKISGDLRRDVTLVASADGSYGFLNTPEGACVKNSELYVADSANGRIAEYGAGSDGDIAYTAGYLDPRAVACDIGGNVYVAHGYNTVSVMGENAHDITVGGIVKQVLVNADKRLFILANNGFYTCMAGDTEAVRIDNASAYKAITLSVGREELYALTAGDVYKLTLDGNTVKEKLICSAAPGAFSLAVDLDDKIFMLTRTKIVRVSKDGIGRTEFKLMHDKTPTQQEEYSLGLASGQILLSTVGNGFVKYGDAIIVDTYKHRIFTADGSADGLGITLIDEHYPVPPVDEDTTPAARTYGLIRTALYEVEVFKYPMEVPLDEPYRIAKGRKVIVPQYDLEDSREYSLILIDDLTRGKLIKGYVYKDSLSKPLPYVDMSEATGKVYSSRTPVYKWPSVNSKTVDGFSSVEKGHSFTFLDFVDSYHDDYNNLWYRVALDDEKSIEGYILAVNVSLKGTEPLLIRPSYDAEIISYEGSEYAQAYDYDEATGKYIPKDFSLAAGTQIEVVGAFDSSEKYTQVKYLEPGVGTRTCYVETVYVKYNGLNVVLLVAIIVIIITVILAAIIIGRTLYLKRKRLSDPPNENGERL